MCDGLGDSLITTTLEGLEPSTSFIGTRCESTPYHLDESPISLINTLIHSLPPVRSALIQTHYSTCVSLCFAWLCGLVWYDPVIQQSLISKWCLHEDVMWTGWMILTSLRRRPLLCQTDWCRSRRPGTQAARPSIGRRGGARERKERGGRGGGWDITEIDY